MPKANVPLFVSLPLCWLERVPKKQAKEKKGFHRSLPAVLAAGAAGQRREVLARHWEDGQPVTETDCSTSFFISSTSSSLRYVTTPSSIRTQTTFWIFTHPNAVESHSSQSGSLQLLQYHFITKQLTPYATHHRGYLSPYSLYVHDHCHYIVVMLNVYHLVSHTLGLGIATTG